MRRITAHAGLLDSPRREILESLVLALVAVGVGFALGWLAGGRSSRAEVARLLAQRTSERVESDRALIRGRKEIEDLGNRLRDQGEAFQYLPELIRELFLAPGPRAVGPVVLKIAEQLLRPEQCALFVVRRSLNRLVLANGFGLPAAIGPGAEVPIGIGRVGYVARAEAPMDDADFRNIPGESVNSATEVRKQVETAGLKDLKVEAGAPILDGKEVIGVIVASGIRARKGQEKRLLGLLADLAAFSLSHANRLRAAEESANLDGLTGVLARGPLETRVGAMLTEAEREKRQLSVVMLDVDDFAAYNKQNGHLAGDELLRQLAQILKGGVRQDDVVARVGGEEFMVVFPGASKDVALGLADGLRESVESYPFRHRVHQPGGVVSVSGGVASYPEDGHHPERLFRCAEEALEMAKAAGRNKVVAATATFQG